MEVADKLKELYNQTTEAYKTHIFSCGHCIKDLDCSSESTLWTKSNTAHKKYSDRLEKLYPIAVKQSVKSTK